MVPEVPMSWRACSAANTPRDSMGLATTPSLVGPAANTPCVPICTVLVSGGGLMTLRLSKKATAPMPMTTAMAMTARFEVFS